MKPESQDTKFGVSVNISTSYLSAARENDELVLIGRVIKEGASSSSLQIWEKSQLKEPPLFPGKRLAFLESDILLKNGDKFIVKGAHTKFLSWLRLFQVKFNVFTIISDLVVQVETKL